MANAQQEPRQAGGAASPYGGEDEGRLRAEIPSAGLPWRVGSVELSPERLRLLLHRLASGFYDTPQVRDRIVERVRQDL